MSMGNWSLGGGITIPLNSGKPTVSISGRFGNLSDRSNWNIGGDLRYNFQNKSFNFGADAQYGFYKDGFIFINPRLNIELRRHKPIGGFDINLNKNTLGLSLNMSIGVYGIGDHPYINGFYNYSQNKLNF